MHCLGPATSSEPRQIKVGKSKSRASGLDQRCKDLWMVEVDIAGRLMMMLWCFLDRCFQINYELFGSDVMFYDCCCVTSSSVTWQSFLSAHAKSLVKITGERAVCPGERQHPLKSKIWRTSKSSNTFGLPLGSLDNEVSFSCLFLLHEKWPLRMWFLIFLGGLSMRYGEARGVISSPRKKRCASLRTAWLWAWLQQQAIGFLWK